MTEKRERPIPENGKHDEPLPETTAPESQTPEAAADDPPADPKALQEALAEARAKAEEYLAGWQRERAEFANFRQRVEQQAAQTLDRVRATVLKGLLDILDDLDMALQHRPTEGEAGAWAEGVEVIANKIQSFLRQHGLEPIEPQPGEPFDPHYHEVFTAEESDEVESGHILAVVRKGYRVGDQVLRPALVKVAR